MITAAIHGTAVAPVAKRSSGDAQELAGITSEIVVRIIEMNEFGNNEGGKLICRLAKLFNIDPFAFETTLAVMHGDTGSLTDSYSERGHDAGRKKQTIHYRTMDQIEKIRPFFPEVAQYLEQMRLSVKHHEDPISQAQTIRDATE